MSASVMSATTGTLAQGDPTGMSSTVGQVVVVLVLLASLALLLRWWIQQRKR